MHLVAVRRGNCWSWRLEKDAQLLPEGLALGTHCKPLSSPAGGAGQMATGSWSRLPQRVPPGFAHLRLRTRPQNPLSLCAWLRRPGCVHDCVGVSTPRAPGRRSSWSPGQERRVGTVLHPREMRWWPNALPLAWGRGAQTCTWIQGKPLTADVVNSGFAPIGALCASLKEGCTSI